MRPGQQNKRMRGRGRGNKQPSGLNRVYESNGPDVKVRGTANHVAEKYLSLSRDAQAAGDPVASENYLQHAEHYFRIIAAVQGQLQAQQAQYNQESFDDEDDEQPGLNGASYGGQANGQNAPHHSRGQNNGETEGQPAAESQAGSDDGEEQVRHSRQDRTQSEDGGRRERNQRRRRRGPRDQMNGSDDAVSVQASSDNESAEPASSAEVAASSDTPSRRQDSAEPVA